MMMIEIEEDQVLQNVQQEIVQQKRKKQGTVKVNQEKVNKLKNQNKNKRKSAKHSIDDEDVFTKLMVNMNNGKYDGNNTDDDDNSDWDDAEEEEDDDGKIGDGLIMNRTPEPHNSKKSRHKSHHNVTKSSNKSSLPKRQSVDDMIIDDYFGNTGNNDDAATPSTINRVHSRIPDHRYKKNTARNSKVIPASFKQFREAQKGGRSYTVTNKSGAVLQKRRSRDHLFHKKHYNNNNNNTNYQPTPKRSSRHMKHKSVHILQNSGDKNNGDEKSNSAFNLGARTKDISYGSSGDEYEEEDDDVKEMVNIRNGRRGSLDASPKYVKHTRGAKSEINFNAIQSQQSLPIGFVSSNNNNNGKTKEKHSRFSSVTNAISKGWKFAKAKGNEQKKKRNGKKKNGKNSKDNKKKNAIFGIDPTTLGSTLLLETDYKSPIPNILIKLREELFINDGHLIEGIFRKAPNGAECKRIEDELNDGKFLQINFSEVDCVLIANLIKIWFRQLPQPILQSIDSSKIEKVQITQNIKDVDDIINNDLNEPFKSYYKWLLDLCLSITKYENKNKMSVKNMAVVAAPNLYDPTKIENPMKAMTVSQAVVHFLQLSIQWRQQQKEQQQQNNDNDDNDNNDNGDNET